MASVIKIKRSSSTSAPSQLAAGEMAFSWGTGTDVNNGQRLFIGTGTETGGAAANIEVIGGSYFTNMLDHTPGTLTAESALIVDANNKLDRLFVDNIAFDGNTISSADVDGNIIISPNGTGVVDVDTSKIVNVSNPTQAQDAATKAYVDNQISSGAASSSMSLQSADDASTATLLLASESLVFDGVNGIVFSISEIDGTSATVTATLEQSLGTTDIVEFGQLDVDNITIDGNTISSTNTDGDINLVTNGNGEVIADSLTVSDLTNTRVVFAGTGGALVDSANLTWTTASDLLTVTGQVQVDNLNLNGNTLSSTNANGSIILDPNGTGVIDASTSRIVNVVDPVSAQDVATKEYVDTIAAASLHYHLPVRVETPESEGNLNAIYDNGPLNDGVGATLTANNNEVLVIDGITLNLNDRVLVYNQDVAAENGVYRVTQLGVAGTTPWILTRTDDADSYAPSDPDSLGRGDAFYVTEGASGAGELYVMNTEGEITFGVTAISFVQISSAQIYSAGDGLALDGVTFSVNVDDSTIEIVGDILRVKDSGITNAKLANDHYTISTNGSGEDFDIQLGDTWIFNEGEGIDISIGSDTVTVTAELATSGATAGEANKGVASFDSTNFAVSSGHVTVNTIDGGSY